MVFQPKQLHLFHHIIHKNNCHADSVQALWNLLPLRELYPYHSHAFPLLKRCQHLLCPDALIHREEDSFFRLRKAFFTVNIVFSHTESVINSVNRLFVFYQGCRNVIKIRVCQTIPQVNIFYFYRTFYFPLLFSYVGYRTVSLTESIETTTSSALPAKYASISTMALLPSILGITYNPLPP